MSIDQYIKHRIKLSSYILKTEDSFIGKVVTCDLLVMGSNPVTYARVRLRTTFLPHTLHREESLDNGVLSFFYIIIAVKNYIIITSLLNLS